MKETEKKLVEKDTVEEYLISVDDKTAIVYMLLLSRKKANDFSFPKDFAEKVNRCEVTEIKIKSYLGRNWSKIIKLELKRRNLIIEKDGEERLNLKLLPNFANQFLSFMRKIGFNEQNVHSYLIELVEEGCKKNGYVLVLEFYTRLLEELKDYLSLCNDKTKLNALKKLKVRDILRGKKEDFVSSEKNVSIENLPMTEDFKKKNVVYYNKEEKEILFLERKYKNNLLKFDEEELKNILKKFKSLKTKKPLDKLFDRINKEIAITGSLLDEADNLSLVLEEKRYKRSYVNKSHPKGRFKRSDYPPFSKKRKSKA